MEPGEYDTVARLENAHWWYAGMRRIAAGWVRQIPLLHREGLPPEILDAGCGVGADLRWLGEFGRVAGVDLHPRAVGYASKVSLRVSQASVLTLPFPTGQFDLVTSFDVLYHAAVPDDVRAMREAARVLRPGGWLLLRVPAHDWLRGAHDRQVHTRERYGTADLKRRLAAAGLTVRRLSGAGASLLGPAIVRRALQKGAAAHSDVAMPPALLNRLLLAGLAAEGWWLRRHNLPAGLSLMALAQKPG